MSQHQPAVIWCPNCGEAVAVPVEVFSVNQHGASQLKVQFGVQHVLHTCPSSDS